MASSAMPKNCFFGKACNCYECKPKLKEICEICRNEEGYKVGSEFKRDRKGIGYYTFIITS